MSRYRRLPVNLHTSVAFRGLSRPQPNAQTLLIYLRTGPPSSALPGLIAAGQAALAEALGWPPGAFRRCFSELEAAGFAEADWDARVVWLPGGLEDEPLQSLNQLKAWAAAFAEIPDSPLKAKACAAVQAMTEGLGEGFREAFHVGFREASAKATAEPSPIQIQKQLQKQKQEEPRPQNAAGVLGLLGLYRELFEARHGKKPNITKGKDAKLLHDLVVQHGEAAVEANLRRYLEDSDPFVLKNGHSLGVFATRFNGLNVNGSGHRSRAVNAAWDGVEAEEARA